MRRLRCRMYDDCRPGFFDNFNDLRPVSDIDVEVFVILDVVPESFQGPACISSRSEKTAR